VFQLVLDLAHCLFVQIFLFLAQAHVKLLSSD
jgi:hypothetical protein